MFGDTGCWFALHPTFRRAHFCSAAQHWCDLLLLDRPDNWLENWCGGRAGGYHWLGMGWKHPLTQVCSCWPACLATTSAQQAPTLPPPWDLPFSSPPSSSQASLLHTKLPPQRLCQRDLSQDCKSSFKGSLIWPILNKVCISHLKFGDGLTIEQS